MLFLPNVTYAKCYLYKMLPRQSVLDKKLLYENVLYETLLILIDLWNALPHDVKHAKNTVQFQQLYDKNH